MLVSCAQEPLKDGTNKEQNMGLPEDMLTYRVDQLELNYGKLDKKIDTLLTNDIPHIQKELEALKTRMSVLTTVNIAAIIFGVIVSRIS